MPTTTPPLDYNARVALASLHTMLATKRISQEQHDTMTKALTAQACTSIQHQEPPPPLSATATFLAQIATRRAEAPGLSFLAASDAVAKEFPELYEQSAIERRYPQPRRQPVTKEEPPSYEQVLKMADERRASQPGVSRARALADLALAHPAAQASRRFHLSPEGRQEHDDAVLAKSQTGS